MANLKNFNLKFSVTEYRIALRVLIETFKGIKQAGIVNIFIVGTMAAILMIFGAIFRTSMSLGSLVSELGNVLEISVYLKSSADANESAGLIRQMEHVQKVKIIAKENSWRDMKDQMRLPNIKNPLPDALHVRVDNQRYIRSVANNIVKQNYVEDIRYAQDIADKIRVVSDISHTATVIVLGVVGFLTMFIINNTIQLVIQSRKKEIEIMRLMGVSNWFIRLPYILQGSLYGIMATIIAIIPLSILQGYILQVHQFFGIPNSENSYFAMIFLLFVMSSVFGALGSLLSIKNKLKI
jgi:cell division transport system permease protein